MEQLRTRIMCEHQYSGNYAWYMNFYSSYRSYGDKPNTYYVRAFCEFWDEPRKWHKER